MALRSPLAVIVACVLIQSSSHGQARPNLSGTWTLTAKPGICPGSLTLLQDDSSLSVQGGGDTRVRIYRFDGTDTREVLAPAPARPATMPPTAYDAHQTRSMARAAWNGDQFVVITHTTMTITWPSQMSGEFEREMTGKDTYSSNAEGQLIVERRIIVDPLPGGTKRRMEIPESWTCAYTKAAKPKPAPRP
jgi:hypothetical protein